MTLVEKHQWAGHMISMLGFPSGITTKLRMAWKQLEVCVLSNKVMADTNNLFKGENRFKSPKMFRFFTFLCIRFINNYILVVIFIYYVRVETFYSFECLPLTFLFVQGWTCVRLLTLQKQQRSWKGKLRRDTRLIFVATMPILLVRMVEKFMLCIRPLLLLPIIYLVIIILKCDASLSPQWNHLALLQVSRLIESMTGVTTVKTADLGSSHLILTMAVNWGRHWSKW